MRRMRILAVKSVMLVTTAALAAVASASIDFRSGEFVLRLSEKCGAVHSIIGTNGVERIVPSAEAFTLQLLDGNGESTRLKSSDFSFMYDGECLSWCHTDGLHVSILVTVTDGEFRFKPMVEGIPSGMLLEWFDGPQVSIAADQVLYWPYVDGIEVADFTRRRSPYHPICFRDRNWRGIYPLYPNTCQMQFLAAYKNGKGTYFSAVDNRHTPKDIDWERIGDNAVRLSLLTFCGDLDKDGAWRPDFYYVLRPYEGGWMEACEIYRDWVRTLPEFHNPPQRPKWMYDSPVNLIYPVRGEGKDNLPRNMKGSLIHVSWRSSCIGKERLLGRLLTYGRHTAEKRNLRNSVMLYTGAVICLGSIVRARLGRK